MGRNDEETQSVTLQGMTEKKAPTYRAVNEHRLGIRRLFLRDQMATRLSLFRFS
jgi:hypothetical protein